MAAQYVWPSGCDNHESNFDDEEARALETSCSYEPATGAHKWHTAYVVGAFISMTENPTARLTTTIRTYNSSVNHGDPLKFELGVINSNTSIERETFRDLTFSFDHLRASNATSIPQAANPPVEDGESEVRSSTDIQHRIAAFETVASSQHEATVDRQCSVITNLSEIPNTPVLTSPRLAESAAKAGASHLGYNG